MNRENRLGAWRSCWRLWILAIQTSGTQRCQSPGTSRHAYAAPDEVIKNTLTNYASNILNRGLQVASRSCRATRDLRADNLLRQSLREEEAMADWIHSHIPDTTQ